MSDCGIYRVTNTITGQSYIGQSVVLLKRLAYHRWQLAAGKHPNRHLQNSFAKYGSAAFEIIVIEHCEPGQITEREQYWCDVFRPKGLFNSRVCVDSNKGMTGIPGRKHTPEESRAKSIRQTGKKQCRPRTEELRNRMSKIKKGCKMAPFTAIHRQRLSEANKRLKQRRLLTSVSAGVF